jgi:hypothetical protein
MQHWQAFSNTQPDSKKGPSTHQISRLPREAPAAQSPGRQRAGPRACPIKAAPRAAKGLQEGGRSTLQHVR